MLIQNAGMMKVILQYILTLCHIGNVHMENKKDSENIANKTLLGHFLTFPQKAHSHDPSYFL